MSNERLYHARVHELLVLLFLGFPPAPLLLELPTAPFLDELSMAFFGRPDDVMEEPGPLSPLLRDGSLSVGVSVASYLILVTSSSENGPGRTRKWPSSAERTRATQVAVGQMGDRQQQRPAGRRCLAGRQAGQGRGRRRA